MKLSPYDKFLLNCYEEYPAINFMGYYDKHGQLHEMTDLTERDGLLWQYEVLEYANIFDRKVNLIDR